MPKLYAEFDVITIPSLDIDWSSGNVFKKNISANSTFTFSNTEDKCIDVAISNTGGSTYEMTFPTTVDIDVNFEIEAGKTAIFSFIKNGSEILVASAST